MKKIFIGILLISSLLFISCCDNDTKDIKQDDYAFENGESEKSNDKTDNEQNKDKNIEVSTDNEAFENADDNSLTQTEEDADDMSQKNNEEFLLEKGEYKITATDFDSIMLLSQEQMAWEFLSALCIGNIKMINQYLGGGGHDEYKNVSMDAVIEGEYEIDDQYTGYAVKVKLNVHESECDTFPVGEHDYLLTFHNCIEASWVKYFGPVEDYIKTKFEIEEFDKKTQDAINFAQAFTDFHLNLTESASKEILFPEKFDDDFRHIVNHTIGGYATRDEIVEDCLGVLTKYLYLSFGYNVHDHPEILIYFEYYSEIDDEIYYELSCVHGGAVYCGTLEKVEKTAAGCNITIALYTDYAYVEKAKEITFVFEKNDNSNIMRLTDVLCKMLSEVKVPFYWL